jgi:hypothetical protein
MKRVDVDELEKLMGQFKSIHAEVSALAKKSPNDAVNSFKIKFINSTVLNCNNFLGETYKPFNDFDVFDFDSVPSNSDVTFIISQYLEALEKYRADNIQCNMGRWSFKLEDSKEEIRTAQPIKLQK